MYNSISVRGLVLETTITAERIIDQFLSDFFCKDEFTGWELNELLWYTQRITFRNKIDVLYDILNRYHGAFFKTNKKFFKDFVEKIISERNNFAHLEIESFKNINNENYTIILKKYKTRKLNLLEYKKEDIENIIGEFNKMTKLISSLNQSELKIAQ